MLSPRLQTPYLVALMLVGASLPGVQGCRGTEPTTGPALDEHSAHSAPGNSPDGVASDPQVFSNLSRAGTYRVTWQSIGRPIPLNEQFTLEVKVTSADDSGAPVQGADVYVQGSMPEHKHGMLREPIARETSPGVYHVEGMLLHMTGYWTVVVDVVKDGIAESTDFELTLE